jgi:hypothetical protein
MTTASAPWPTTAAADEVGIRNLRGISAKLADRLAS